MRIELNNGKFYTTTDAMTGKMKGMHSLNTSPSVNPFCQKMQSHKEFICNKCYSNGVEARWKNAKNAWINNFYVLSENLLQPDELFKTREEIYRFAAQGDLHTRIQYLNYVAIARNNPQTIFALWSKRLDIIADGGVIQLPNLIHIYSTPKLNPVRVELPAGFDKVFSVYNFAFAKEHGVDINCGARSCITCRLCYAKNNITHVNEIIKADHKKLAGITSQ